MVNHVDEWGKRWPHFQPHEVFSSDQLHLFESKGVCPYSFRAFDKLHQFRIFLRKPVIINIGSHRRRGARSMKEVLQLNLETRGGDKWGYSFHLWCAFDISVLGMGSFELFYKALEFGMWGGVGLYDTFVHLDDRDNLDGKTVTWDNRTKKEPTIEQSRN